MHKFMFICAIVNTKHTFVKMPPKCIYDNVKVDKSNKINI